MLNALYVRYTFPKKSETFVADEVLAWVNAGNDIRVLANSSDWLMDSLESLKEKDY